MNRLQLLLMIVALAMCQCSVREGLNEGSNVSYSMQTLRKESAGCEKQNTPCASYQVTYPLFTSRDERFKTNIQSRIDETVSLDNPEADGWSMDQIADNFIQGFENFRKENGDSLLTNWFYKATVQVNVQHDTLISLRVDDESFTGGAHGGGGSYFINVNPKTGSDFLLEHLLKPGYITDLTTEAEKVFRTKRQLADSVSFSESGFEFPEDKFELTENYGFTPEGIVFVFNSYEIAPYALGPTEIVVPYEKIKDWLR